MLAFRQYSFISNGASYVIFHAWFSAERYFTSFPPLKLPPKNKSEPSKKPKEPPSLTFLNNNEQALPSATQPLSSQHWKNLDEMTRRKKSDYYHKELEDYLRKLREHCKSVLSAPPPSISNNPKKELKIKHAKPTKPASAYNLFVADQLKLYDQRFNRKLLFEEIVKNWRAIGEEERHKYFEKHSLANQKYKKELEEWEQEMLRLGNEDLVRKKTIAAVKKLTKPMQRRKSENLKISPKTSKYSIFHGLVSIT